MDQQTLAAYDGAARTFAQDWHEQPPPTDLHALVRRWFRPGLTADIGCGSGREVSWLVAQGFLAVGYDASQALLDEARRRYPALLFEPAALPELAGVPETAFDNVLCETVIMHLPRNRIVQAVRRLLAIVRPGGILYLSWRVTADADQRDPQGRLYTAFDAGLVRGAIAGVPVLLDEQVTSVSSSKTIHRMVARKHS
jgi:SAM-dependent methyltransferase